MKAGMGKICDHETMLTEENVSDTLTLRLMSPFTQTLKKGGGQQDGQREKEEIHSLQEQLAALKEITVGGAVIRLRLRQFLQ